MEQLSRIYFIGIGGIGMSALARYFHGKGLFVSGYDRTETELTRNLQQEGMTICFEDDVALLDKDADLVVYTPAIPADH
ncbi:MAG: UDP-N-acetylmuramate--L-alanine ligase, partial [Chitinophagales bacterium]|nr:UDP-N-acetylmuramate--L-alanine ligase [Chitinophagales bacterium]